MNVESVTYENEEDGLWLILELDVEIPLVTNEGRLRVRVQNVSEELYDRTKAAILPWLMERDEARDDVAGMRAFFERKAMEVAFGVDSGYDTSDPKHPDFHSVHADLWDMREGK